LMEFSFSLFVSIISVDILDLDYLRSILDNLDNFVESIVVNTTHDIMA